jgi:hypothetical protein
MKTLLLINIMVVMALGASAEKSQRAQPVDVPVSSSEFKLVEKRGDIALYERWFLYDSTTKAREIKVVFEVKADLQSAINLLRDETSSAKWNLHTSEFRILRENNDRWVNYIRYDLPWPVSDHDCVLRYNMQMPSASKCLIFFESGADGHFPVSDKFSRLSDIRGKWLFEEQRETIHIEYSVTTMPSSTLPRWVTDPIIRNNLLDMMTKFTRLLETINN